MECVLTSRKDSGAVLIYESSIRGIVARWLNCSTERSMLGTSITANVLREIPVKALQSIVEMESMVGEEPEHSISTYGSKLRFQLTINVK